MTIQAAPKFSLMMAKAAAYSAAQVAEMYDTGGAADSIKLLGTLGGGALGGAASLASALRNPVGGAPDYAQAMIGAGVGAGLGNLASRLVIHGQKGLNKRYSVAEGITNIPRSKLEELPIASKLRLLHHADAELQARRRKEKYGASVYQGPRDFSATQLREYQLKHLEPGMGRVIDAVGATGGALLGGAAGQQLGDHPILGAVGGSLAGLMLARSARHQASKGIAKHYLTRRVMEEASGAPISSQIRGLRERSAPVVRGVESLIVGAPKGAPLKLVSKPTVEGLP